MSNRGPRPNNIQQYSQKTNIRGVPLRTIDPRHERFLSKISKYLNSYKIVGNDLDRMLLGPFVK